MANKKKSPSPPQAKMRIHHIAFGDMYIIDDGSSYMVREPKGKNTYTLGYFMNLDGAIKRILRQRIVNDNEEMDLTDLVKKYKDQMDKISKELNI